MRPAAWRSPSRPTLTTPRCLRCHPASWRCRCALPQAAAAGAHAQPPHARHARTGSHQCAPGMLSPRSGVPHMQACLQRAPAGSRAHGRAAFATPRRTRACGLRRAGLSHCARACNALAPRSDAPGGAGHDGKRVRQDGRHVKVLWLQGVRRPQLAAAAVCTAACCVFARRALQFGACARGCCSCARSRAAAACCCDCRRRLPAADADCCAVVAATPVARQSCCAKWQGSGACVRACAAVRAWISSMRHAWQRLPRLHMHTKRQHMHSANPVHMHACSCQPQHDHQHKRTHAHLCMPAFVLHAQVHSARSHSRVLLAHAAAQPAQGSTPGSGGAADSLPHEPERLPAWPRVCRRRQHSRLACWRLVCWRAGASPAAAAPQAARGTCRRRARPCAWRQPAAAAAA